VIPFELVEPRSLAKAVALLDPEDPSVRPIAGGTALMLMMKANVFQPTRLVSLRRVEKKFSRIQAEADGGIRIGALATLGALERAAAVKRRLPVVADTLRILSNVRVRNVATVGGNLAHGDPHMDLPPVLMALGAGVAIVGPAGKRSLAVEDLFAGYYETVLARNELIAELHIPAQGGRRAAYLKCTTGSADDWPALGVAVSLDAEGQAIRSARLVVSAATEKAIRLKSAEAVLAGAEADDGVLARAGEAAVAEAEMVADVRGSAAYKRELLRVYVARAVRKALAAKTKRRRS
jgi:aerobic carbon-monoxide dehydrogenase medium subunit